MKKNNNAILFKLFWYKVFEDWNYSISWWIPSLCTCLDNQLRFWRCRYLNCSLLKLLLGKLKPVHTHPGIFKTATFLLESAFCPQETSDSDQRNCIFLKPLSRVCVCVCVFFFWSPTVLWIFVDEIVVFCLLIYRNTLRLQLLNQKRVGPARNFRDILVLD